MIKIQNFLQFCEVRTILVCFFGFAQFYLHAQIELQTQIIYTPQPKIVSHILFYNEMQNEHLEKLELNFAIGDSFNHRNITRELTNNDLMDRIFYYKNYWIAKDTIDLDKANVVSFVGTILNAGFNIEYYPGAILSDSKCRIASKIFCDRIDKNGQVQWICPRSNFFSERNEILYVHLSQNQLCDQDITLRIVKDGKNEKVVQFFDINSLSFGQDTVIEFDIDSLRSGNYSLQIGVLENGRLKAQSRTRFQKANYKEIDELEFAYRNMPSTIVDVEKTFVQKYDFNTLCKNAYALYPIASSLEYEVIDKLVTSGNDSMLRKFFYNFWQARNASYPDSAWSKYVVALNEVAYMYGRGGVKGYLTDRGRIYLRYGKPDYTEKVPNESGTLPYEVWMYNKSSDHDEGVFLFVATSNFTQQLKLLHSTMPGEPYFADWERVLITKEGGEHRVYEFLNKGRR